MGNTLAFLGTGLQWVMSVVHWMKGSRTAGAPTHFPQRNSQCLCSRTIPFFYPHYWPKSRTEPKVTEFRANKNMGWHGNQKDNADRPRGDPGIKVFNDGTFPLLLQGVTQQAWQAVRTQREMQVTHIKAGRAGTILQNAFGKNTLEPILKEIQLSRLAVTEIHTIVSVAIHTRIAYSLAATRRCLEKSTTISTFLLSIFNSASWVVFKELRALQRSSIHCWYSGKDEFSFVCVCAHDLRTSVW